MQLAGGVVVESGWDPLTLLPDMDQLRREIKRGVKMVVITTPGETAAAGEMLCELVPAHCCLL